ncbi:MAG: sucrose phosphorylase [Granulosicoccus sp.]
MKNQVQLITYVDRLTGSGFKEFKGLMDSSLKDVFGGVHFLPFFEKIDGEDAGFDPVDHTAVDKRLGDWSYLSALSNDFDIMGDIIVNHMSSDSQQFQDYLQKGADSKYAKLFLHMSDIFKEGVSEEELLDVYRPRPGLPFTRIDFPSGDSRLLWTTFTEKQIDINVRHEEGVKYLESILDRFKSAGITIIRLDAAGYAIKKEGDTCFMMPETFDFIEEFTEKAHALGMIVLVEIHAYFKQQIEIAEKVDLVYDFAMPPLVLYALYTHDCSGLKTWLGQSPRNCITVLDTHDGIGIIDVAPHGDDKPGILANDDIEFLVQEIHEKSNGESRKATGEAASNLDLYQVNCSFYSALGENDQDYLLSRLIQFICPGIPQVYYMGLLAGKNDMQLLAESGVGRDINRHYYTVEEVEKNLERPVVRNLVRLIQFRNAHPAFSGDFTVLESEKHIFNVYWYDGSSSLYVKIDLKNKGFEITSILGENQKLIKDWANLTV